MSHSFYEEKTRIANFGLYHMDGTQLIAHVHNDIHVENQANSLLFLHIKTLDVSNMRMPFSLHDNDSDAKLCFITFNRNANGDMVSEFKCIKTGSIFSGGKSSSSLDRFIEMVNRTINYYVDENMDKLDCRILYGNFTIEENKLQYKYQSVFNGNVKKKIAVLAFNDVYMNLILKYFDTHLLQTHDEAFYYIRPAYTIDDIDNDFINLPAIRNVPAFRDTTYFFFPYYKLFIAITNDPGLTFNNTVRGFVESSHSFNLSKAYSSTNIYILLADKQTSLLPVSYILYVNGVTDTRSFIAGTAEYIVLKDEFDQFDMFKLKVGDIYSAEEYRELSYRKLMGITANTVYLQNGSSTELLRKLLARLELHLPDIAQNGNASLWQSIRDLVGDKETLEQIYNLLYHAYPYEPVGPQIKKLKIDF